jgi:hypothetical protein
MRMQDWVASEAVVVAVIMVGLGAMAAEAERALDFPSSA